MHDSDEWFGRSTTEEGNDIKIPIEPTVTSKALQLLE